VNKEPEANFPTTKRYSRKIETSETEFTLNLFIIEYSNAIQVSVYDNKPSLGSMSFGFIDGELSQNLEIFTGKHNQYSNALALILAKKTNKVIYASVNLERDSVVDLSMIKKLLENYFNELSTS
jgi:hypothetical protein